jgi:hypothetical protein
MEAECGFDRQAAVVAVGALVGKVNERFGDSVSLSACLTGLKEFFNSGVDLNCRSCGWRKPRSRLCTKQCVVTSDSDTCEHFAHLFEANAK